MSDSEKIDIGIVNYNGGAALRTCLRSLEPLGEYIQGVFVFDNASDDQDELIETDLAGSLPHFTLIRSPKNLGYGGACNALLGYMNQHYIAFANMDLRFDPNWGREIINTFKANLDCCSVASLVMYEDGSTVNGGPIHMYKDLHPQNMYAGFSLDQVPADVAETFGAYGAIMAFRREVFDTVKGFSESFFLFSEETELYIRMNLMNKKTLFNPRARVYHCRSLSTVRYSSLKLYYAERNRMHTIIKLFPLYVIPVALCYSIQRFWVLASRVPSQDAQGAKISKHKIILTIMQAWGVALLQLPITRFKSRSFWKTCPRTRSDSVKLARNYRFDTTELTL